MSQTAEVLGTIGLLMFALTSLLSTSGASIGLALLVLATVLHPPTLKDLRRDPMVILAVISCVYLVIRTLWAIREIPETTRVQASQAWAWFRLWLFVVVAWWLKGDLRRSGRVLLFALLGLLTGMAGHLLSHPHLLESSERTGFHLKIIAFGLYSGTAILGLAILAPRILGSMDNLARFTIRLGLLLISLVALVQGLIMTRSRGAWLAAVVVIPVVILLRYRSAAARRGWSLRRQLLSAALALVIAAVFVVMNLRTIDTRLSEEREMFAAAWRGDFEAVPSVGFGVRVQTFRFGVTKWLERPLFGWGPGSTEYLISHSGLRQLRHSEMIEGEWKPGPNWLDHLHNTYLEVLVRFGLLGAFLMVSVLGLLVRGFWVAYREGRLPVDYTWFLAGTLGLVAIWSLSDFRLLHPDWRSYWVLVVGISGTFHLWRTVPTCSDAEGPSPPKAKAEQCHGRHE